MVGLKFFCCLERNIMGLLDETISGIAPQNTEVRKQAKDRLDKLAIPHWSLGKLQDLALQLAGITGSMHPEVKKRVVVTCAGDHGVVAEGVSAFPKEVSIEMVKNFLNSGGSVNALAAASATDVLIADFGVDADFSQLGERLIDKKVRRGTRNFYREPAMTREEAVQAVEGGIEIVRDNAEKYDVFATGDMGIGNTTPSSAICSVFTGGSAQEVTGRGTGIADAALSRKIEVIDAAVKLHNPDPSDGIDILSKVGGYEIGGIAGIILGAAAQGKPVVVDGFISTAGALIAATLAPLSKEYMISAHKSVEIGHIRMLELLGLDPMLDLNFRLGEGTGSVVCMNLLDAAVAVLSNIMTFEEAAVSPQL